MISLTRLPSYTRVPVRYGLYSGIVGFAFMMLLYHLGHHPMLIPFFFDYRIPLLGIVMFFSLKESRDYYGMKEFFFWQGMVGGAILTVCFASIVSICLYIYIALDGNFLSSYIALSLEQLKSFSEEDIERLGQTNYEDGIRFLQQATAKEIIRLRIIQSLIIGLLVSIIVAVILRKHTHKNHG